MYQQAYVFSLSLTNADGSRGKSGEKAWRKYVTANKSVSLRRRIAMCSFWSTELEQDDTQSIISYTGFQTPSVGKRNILEKWHIKAWELSLYSHGSKEV